MDNLPTDYKIFSDDQRIALPDKNGLVFIEVKKIIRCQSDNSYTDFFILDESIKKRGSTKIEVSKGFDYFKSFLNTHDLFYRVHNRHIININHIQRYTKSNGGYLIMDDNSDTMIPVARARKEEFLNYLKSKRIIL
jgi:two-component system, LytTR family, response regulator